MVKNLSYKQINTVYFMPSKFKNNSEFNNQRPKGPELLRTLEVEMF